MNAKKTLGAIVAAAVLGSGAGCASMNRTLYEAGDEIRFKYEEVKNPLEWHSFSPDYRMTIKEIKEDGKEGVVFQIIDNDRDFRIDAYGNDIVIVTKDGKTEIYDRSTEKGKEFLGRTNLDHKLYIFAIVDQLPKDVRAKYRLWVPADYAKSLREQLGIDKPEDEKKSD